MAKRNQLECKNSCQPCHSTVVKIVIETKSFKYYICLSRLFYAGLYKLLNAGIKKCIKMSYKISMTKRYSEQSSKDASGFFSIYI